MTKELRRAGTLAVAALALSLPMLLGTGSCHRNPIIFVHGGSGSGAQFESQAMRFTSNGYPQGHIAVLEYDSSQPLTTNPANMAALHARLDRWATVHYHEAVTASYPDVMPGHAGLSFGFRVEHRGEVLDDLVVRLPPSGVRRSGNTDVRHRRSAWRFE